ncbi:MAG: hypothetical protein A2V69_00825 [Candidatus Portnoybacteria bacterium RBG_13_40_8]|uniref:Uncharacterized protein n=1 Tax=Candidatus Portnoybacteria bacterium RBG_13_40_8 TaxID=1801990 RepID=A0A1G2F3R0_9BACT|nr:MAG: hypothetical protein A2V69_00825 [Candidatus Portnoybacteria bacterium RBG_13_40_8]OGZ34510.1 MAG: hypothetical protein A2V60_03005 [Candidatus Portnoybacteria bacterium RIFCSPHIGHO2_01_FULL_39_19]
MSGLKLAALYGIKPHSLGFCGPRDKGILLKYLSGENISEKKIRKILEQFKGAYPYYESIAKSNNIKDPFDERVVRAYWIGNKLLAKAGGAKSHHSHHVLVVGSVTGKIVLKGKLLDLCRIGWGRVISVKCKTQSAKIIVKYQPLAGKKKLKLGKLTRKDIDWDRDLLSNVIRVGDWISFHWNQAVEVLRKEDVKNLEKYTKITLNSL